MKNLLRLLKTGSAIGVLAAMLPAAAETVTLTSSDGSAITDGSSQTSVTVTGGGTVALTNASNSYSGGTTVTGNSTLQVGTDTELGASSGSLTLGSNSSAGTLDLTPTTGAVTSSRSLSFGGTGATINGSSNVWTFSGVVSGSAPLTINGGTVAFTNTGNSYSGGTTITNGGTLQAPTDTALGSSGSTLTLNNGTLDTSSNTSGVIGSVRPITLGAGGGTIITAPTDDAWTYSGIVSGTGALHLTSPSGTPGLTYLTGINTYSGGTTVNEGTTLSIGADSNLGATTGGLTLGDDTTNTGGTLALSNGAPVSTSRPVSLQGTAGGTIDSGASPWTFTTGFTGDGPLTIGGNSAIILDGQNTYSGLTTVSGGTLELGDPNTSSASIANDVTVTTLTTAATTTTSATTTTGTLTGTGSVLGLLTNNSGTVEPGVNGAGSLRAGSFVQNSGGNLIITLTPNATSTLAVSGNATLGGTLALNPLGLLHGGTVQLLTASSITGSFTQLPGQISVGFNQTLTQTGDAIDLTLKQLTAIPENPSLYRALSNTVLDDAQRSNETILEHLSDARTSAKLDQMVMANWADHPTDDCEGCTPFGSWFQPYGGFGSTSGSTAAPGYSANDVGFLAGIDSPVFDQGDDAKYVAGVALAFSRDAVDESGGANGTILTPRVMAYGSYWVGPNAIDGSVGLGYASFTGNRPIVQNGGNANSTYNGVQVTSALQASRVFDIRSIVLTPAVGFRFAHQAESSFNESGAGAYDLDGLTTSANSLRPYVSATAAKRFDVGVVTRIEPQLRVAYAVETLNTPGVSVDPTNDDYTFHYPGITPARGQASVNAGVTVETSHSLNLFSDAGIVAAGNTRAAQFDAGIRCRF